MKAWAALAAVLLGWGIATMAKRDRRAKAEADALIDRLRVRAAKPLP